MPSIDSSRALSNTFVICINQLERVQLLGLVDSPPLDSQVPVDSLFVKIGSVELKISVISSRALLTYLSSSCINPGRWEVRTLFDFIAPLQYPLYTYRCILRKWASAKKRPPGVTIRVKINPFHTSFIFILPIADML